MLKNWKIDNGGWLLEADIIPSPNCEARPRNKAIELIVVHAISLPPGQFGGGYVQQFFCNQLEVDRHEYFQQIADMRVSAHCLVERNGHVTQFVSFLDRAWHAGVSCWHDRQDCNDFSIGIELEGCDEEAFEELQYQQLARLVISMRNQYPALTSESLCGHSEIAPGRKTDPGPFFDWQKLNHLINELS